MERCQMSASCREGGYIWARQKEDKDLQCMLGLAKKKKFILSAFQVLNLEMSKDP